MTPVELRLHQGPLLSRRGRTTRSTTGEGLAPLEDLAVAAAGGNMAAFGEIYERLAPTVLRYVGARARDLGDPADLAQDVFLALHRSLPTYVPRPEVPFGAWAMRVARSCLADTARRTRRCPMADMSDDALAEVAATQAGPEERAVAADEAANVWRRVTELRPAHQDVLALRFVAGLSVDETAQAMGKSAAAVKVLQYRALRSLHRKVRT